MVYDKRAATIHDDYVSLATVNGRVECDYVRPRDDTRETPYSTYVAGDEYEFRTSTLQYDAATQEFFFHITTRNTTATPTLTRRLASRLPIRTRSVLRTPMVRQIPSTHLRRSSVSTSM